MSPSPLPRPQNEPFTATSDFDTASFASLYSAKSQASPGQSNPMDGYMSSKLASLSSNLAKSNPNSQPTTLATSAVPTSAAASITTPSAASAPSLSSVTSTQSVTDTATSTSILSGTTSSPSALASSAANNATNDLQKQASSGMSSPGMQAAVAVPVVVVVLAGIALIFFCMRRRKKRAAVVVTDETEKTPQTSRRRDWTRHLRVFSFDTELLMGGRYSSTNSIRSRQTGSLRSATRSQHSESPSLHSVDEVAPPYRDAISAAQPPNIGSVIAGAAPVIGGAAAAGTLNRSTSSATAGTAPPPYGVAAGRLAPTSPSVRSQHSASNPFADNENSPISPAEGSPFQDPPSATPSRNSSLYRSDRDDASTIGGVSDAASIRQATLARNASVMSGGRIIDNVARGTQ